MTVQVNSNRGPSTNGQTLYFPANRARLPGDTILHEYGHTLMFEMYPDGFPDGQTDNDGGHPGQCPNDCANYWNHNAAFNDCSVDAIIEGWANYYPVAVYTTATTPHSPSDHSYDWSNSTSTWDLEDNSEADVFQTDQADGSILNVPHGNSNHPFDEYTVASILWDLFDGESAADNDRLEIGGDQVWNLMMNEMPFTTKELYEIAYLEFPDLRYELWEIFSTHSLTDTQPATDAPVDVVPTTGSVYPQTSSISPLKNSTRRAFLSHRLRA
ncbi:hypothetical protein KKG45_02755 [bacterium]|nr:hypothetical protein [bacterium]MBU1072143.1 hypothetical protein [bacterium]